MARGQRRWQGPEPVRRPQGQARFHRLALGIAALAAGFQGWALRRTTRLERWLLIVAGFALAYPAWAADLVGFGLVLAVLAMQYLRRLPQPA